MKPSKKNRFPMVAVVPLVLLLPAARPAFATECTSLAFIAKGVSMDAPRQSTVDFSPSGGQLDPVPLIETTILVRGSCVMAHFSAQADPLDNHIMFQVSIDDVPMLGHTQFPYLVPAPPTLVVWDPEETNFNLSRMLAYNFVARVTPGVHVVRVRFAGCCSANPGSAVVRAAVLTLEY
jgi:hypothetical protein